MLAGLLVARATVGHGAWVVDANGACVEQWSSSDALRGPTAIVNAPLLPVRTFAGGAEYAWNNSEWWPWQIAVLGPAVTVFSGAAGLIEAVWWVGTGLADTLTGGYFALAPEAATELSVRPTVPGIITDAKPPSAPQDRCGRPT